MKKEIDKAQKGFPLQGHLVGPDFLTGAVATGHELIAYSDHYLQQSGLNPKSGVAIEFQTLMTILHFLVSYDQVNVLNLAGGEFIMRRGRMIQKALTKNAK
eukprot:16390898-Heterocapsa_arctica.AAC.1